MNYFQSIENKNLYFYNLLKIWSFYTIECDIIINHIHIASNTYNYMRNKKVVLHQVEDTRFLHDALFGSNATKLKKITPSIGLIHGIQVYKRFQ